MKRKKTPPSPFIVQRLREARNAQEVAEVLSEVRYAGDRLHEEHHRNFCLAFAAKARQYDKIREEENKLPAEAEVLDVQEKNTDDEL